MHKKQTLLIALTTLAVLLLGGAAFALVHVQHVKHAQQTSGPIPTVQNKGRASTPTPSSSGKQSTSTNSSTTPPASSKAVEGSTPSTALLTPTGDFVSSHHPASSGSGAREKSVCSTTPGAKCDIEFVSADGITKDLGEKITDANGAAYWDWTIDGANLAPGEWTVKAVATLNGQTTTATDALKLEVQ